MTAKFVGPGAGKAFAREAGSHCVQRIPPTEKNGKRQTSYVMVAVLPMPPKHEIKLLPECEIEVTTMRGTGPGGQHRNMTDSCVRMVHKETKISVVIDARDQHANRREAHRILSVRVNELKNGQTQAAYDEMRKAQLGDGGRGEKIRTYNFIKRRAVDHRTNVKTNAVDQVIERGRFDLLLKE